MQEKLLRSWQNTTTKGNAEIHLVYKEQWQPTTAISAKLVLKNQDSLQNSNNKKIPKRARIIYAPELQQQLVARALTLIFEVSEMKL